MKPVLLCLGLALAACSTIPPSNRSAARPYRALGTEPFWSVTLGDRQMTFESPEAPPVVMPLPAPRTQGQGRRYETPRLTMDIAPGPCSDGMSDRRYADRVTVVMDGRRLEGCGGDVLAPARLDGTAWAIVEIGGAAVSGEAYHLQFESGRLRGQAGCNRFSGLYQESDGTLAPGPVVATRMACPGPRMDHELQVMELLSGPVRFEHPDGDTLVLTGSGRTIRLRRSI